MTYAFVPTSNNSILAFTGTPGIATDRYALVWDNGSKSFTLGLPAITGPDQFSGVLPVSKGGTGTATGSITGTGALAFTAGGQNQSVTISATGNTSFNPNGPGNVFLTGSLNVTSNSNSKLVLRDSRGIQTGITFEAPNSNSNSYYVFIDNQGFNFFDNTRFKTAFLIAKNGNVGFGEYFSGLGSPSANFEIVNSAGTIRLIQADDLSFKLNQTLDSTSTTSGACVIAGGLGLSKNLNVGGNLTVSGSQINFANLPTSNTGLAVGNLWRDGEIVKVKL